MRFLLLPLLPLISQKVNWMLFWKYHKTGNANWGVPWPSAEIQQKTRDLFRRNGIALRFHLWCSSGVSNSRFISCSFRTQSFRIMFGTVASSIDILVSTWHSTDMKNNDVQFQVSGKDKHHVLVYDKIWQVKQICFLFPPGATEWPANVSSPRDQSVSIGKPL